MRRAPPEKRRPFCPPPPLPPKMLRALLYAILSIFAITFIRMVIGLITKSMGDLFREETASQQQPGTGGGGGAKPGPASIPTAGELKPCRKCGTYVLASAALTVQDKGGTAYFCSKDCREKFAAPA